MKKLYLTILLIPLLILGGSAPLAADACPSVSAILIAHDDGKNSSKISGAGISYIQVHPDTVNVDPGCYFTLYNPGKHEIYTTSTEDWMNRPTPTTGNITMGPAPDVKDGLIFKYTVHVKDLGDLDPRARIKR